MRDDHSLAMTVESETLRFKRRIFFVSSGLISLASLLTGIYLIFTAGQVINGVIALAFLPPSFVAFVASRRDKMSIAAYSFIVGISTVLVASLFFSTSVDSSLVLSMLCLFLALMAFLVHPLGALVLGAGDIAVMIGFQMLRYQDGSADAFQQLGYQTAVVVLFTAVVYSLASNARTFREGLRTRVVTIEEAVPDLVAAGERVAAAAEEIHSMANQQSQGAIRQSSAVQQTREALHSTLTASKQIARTAQDVFSNAEKTSRTTEISAERVATLSAQTGSIIEILDAIKAIATKSELLALNAALESTKAGEAGRGFKLVANQMQQLAEQVMQAVRQIKALTGEIRESTLGVQLSMEDTLKLARLTTEAGREISLVTQQQQTSTEQVTNAMDDIAEITSYTAEGSQQTLASTEELAKVVSDFPTVVQRLTKT